MESKDNQGDKMFESTANGEWGNPNQPVCDPELHEIIRRIYDDKLTDEMLAPKMRYDLIRLLLPSCPKKVIANAKKNQSSLKETNLQYHLLKLVPQLFIASLHYRNYDRAQQTTNMMEACGGHNRLLYKNRFEHLIARHLNDRDELFEQIQDLEQGKGYMLESEHRREMKELIKQHREELEEENYQVAKKKEKEKFVFEKENYSLKHENEILKRRVEALEKVLEIKSNDSVSITTSEMDDEKELEKEEVSLD